MRVTKIVVFSMVVLAMLVTGCASPTAAPAPTQPPAAAPTSAPVATTAPQPAASQPPRGCTNSAPRGGAYQRTRQH